MKHIRNINEFFNFGKNRDSLVKVDLDEKGWVLFSEREPDPSDVMQATNSYRINGNWERVSFTKHGNMTHYFKYKIIRDGRIIKSGNLVAPGVIYDQWTDSNTREAFDDIDRMGDIYWFDFTSYKAKLEDDIISSGFQVGLPVEVINIDHMLKRLTGKSSSLKSIYRKDYLNQVFSTNTIGVNVDDDKLYASVFLSVGFGTWFSTDNVKPLK